MMIWKQTCKISHGYSQVGTQASCLWHCDSRVGNLHRQTQRFQIMFFHQLNAFIHLYLDSFQKINSWHQSLVSRRCVCSLRMIYTSQLWHVDLRGLSFFFFFLFYMFINTIHPWSFMRKTFLCTSIWQTASVHTLEFFLFTSHGLYIQSLFTFKDFYFPQHTLIHKSTLVAHTHKNSFPRIIYTQESFCTHFPPSSSGFRIL